MMMVAEEIVSSRQGTCRIKNKFIGVDSDSEPIYSKLVTDSRI
jgi:hypothetical protein